MAGESSLFSVGETPRRPGRRRTGRHERQLDRSVRELGLETGRDAAAVSAARAVACQLDVAEEKGDSYATAQLVRPYRELLVDLGVIRERVVGGGEDDPFDGLGAATMGDATDAGPA